MLLHLQQQRAFDVGVEEVGMDVAFPTGYGRVPRARSDTWMALRIFFFAFALVL
jgi:hypothetical protein